LRFLAKSLGGFHPFTFVTFLLQVKKVTKKPRRCASIGLKSNLAHMQANSSCLASNNHFFHHFVKQACLLAYPLFNFLTPNTCKADPFYTSLKRPWTKTIIFSMDDPYWKIPLTKRH
ncbi:hypothetical protein, partial [Echinicola rosea]|uniref:hypothetical protein n=1 Tax=Echinicola rosea TaxID=1807691 RepID=UPI001E60B3CE